MAETHLGAVNIGGNIIGIDSDHMGEQGVDGDGILGDEDDIHGDGRAGARAVAFHGHHAIHDIEFGRDEAVEIDEHFGKVMDVGKAGMALAFVKAVDAAVGVFDGAGEAGQPMGFHFAQGDDGVGFQHGVGDLKALDELPFGEVDGFARGKLAQGDAVIPGDVGDARFLGHAVGVAPARGVAVGEFVKTGFLKQADDGLEDCRMGGAGGVGGHGAKHVGL